MSDRLNQKFEYNRYYNTKSLIWSCDYTLALFTSITLSGPGTGLSQYLKDRPKIITVSNLGWYLIRLTRVATISPATPS